MPNIASALKEEIARVARKELRTEVDQLRKATSRYRKEIAALKRRLAALEKLAARRPSRAASSAEAPDDESAATKLRFRAGGLASHRQRLGLSAADFGKLVGVTGQSIYKWESGKARPRAAQLAAIAEVRKLGKNEALARLQGS